MAIIILENSGVDITNIDGAVFNNFASGNRSGIMGGCLNECALSATGNSIILSTGCLLLHGIRVKITEVESVVMSSTPSQDARYQLIAQVIVDTSGKVKFSLFIQTVQALTQDSLYVDGMGIYQLEIGRFTHTVSGAIQDIVRTADTIYGGSSITADVDVGTVITDTLPAGVNAEVDIDKRLDGNKTLLDFKFSIPTPAGTTVLIDGEPEESISFVSDPQTQLNEIKDFIALKQPKVVEDVISGSRITATNDVEIIDSQPSVKTAEIKSIKGCSIKAIQKNGNFDGMAGWVLNDATATTSNGIATFTVTANSDCGIAADSSQQSLQSIAGHKYYISAWIKAKYARSVDFGFSNDPIQFTAVANQWVRLSVLAIPSIDGDTFYLTHNCSAQYAIGDTFQIQDFRVIDLTESDQSLFNMTKEQLDEKLSTLPYFEGIRHTHLTKLISTGDNLWDYKYFYDTLQAVNSANIIYEDKDGRNCIKISSPNLYQNVQLCKGKFAPNVRYIFKLELYHQTNETQAVGTAFFIKYTDGTNSYEEIAVGLNAWNEAVFVSSENKTIDYIAMSYGTGATVTYINIDKFQLQLESNPNTEYKPYKEDTVNLPDIILQSDDELTPTQHIRRRDEITGELLEEPIYTPIEWDNKYSAYNYGMEKTVAGANGHGMAIFTIKYPLDVVKQVETNTEMIQQLEKQIQALLGG